MPGAPAHVNPVKPIPEILAEERDCLAQMLHVSQDMLDQAKNPDLSQLESLLAERSTLLRQVEQLEAERSRYGEVSQEGDETHRSAVEAIVEILKSLQVLDGRIADQIFDGQLRLINNMALLPNHINFTSRLPGADYSERQVVDVTR